MKVALILLVVATAAPSVRVEHVNGSKVVIETRDRVQHVTVTDRNGELEAESWCDWQSGSYDSIVRLGRALVTAAKRRDRHALVSLMQFPLRVNYGSAHTVWIRDRATFLARFNSVVTPKILAQIREDVPAYAFCRNGMSMVAGGTMWATTDAHGVLKVAVINH